MTGLAGFGGWIKVLGAGGIQSVFTWGAYNQNSLRANISWRQVQQYQKKNYGIAWISIARRDILSMMGISVNRINNYLIIATLILGVDFGVIWSARFTSESEDPGIIMAFYCNSMIAVIWLLMSIMLGIQGQNKAFSYTLKLLTWHMRPENPAQYDHDYMQQMQWLEQQGIFSLFRIPGLMPERNYGADQEASDLREHFGDAHHEHRKSKADDMGEDIEDFTPLENLDVQTTHTWYIARYSDFMQLWLWHEKYARLTMGLGVISLLQGGLYFVVWRISHLGDYSIVHMHTPALIVAFFWLTILYIVVRANFKAVTAGTSANIWLAALLLAPLAAAFSCIADAFTVLDLVTWWFESSFNLVCYALHAVFWALVLVLHENDNKILAEKRYVLGQFWSAEETDFTDVSALEREREQSDRAIEVNVDSQSGADSAARNPLNVHAAQTEWPTDSAQFIRKVSRSRDAIRAIVKHLVTFTIVLWLFLIAHYTAELIAYSSDLAETNKPLPAAVVKDDVYVDWSDEHLKLHSVACMQGKIFMANDQRIGQLHAGRFHPLSCNLTAKAIIQDITVVCDNLDRCDLVVLQVVDNSTRVSNCRTGDSTRILQEAEPARHITLHEVNPRGDWLSQKLIAAQDGNLIQYSWSSDRGAWQADWVLGPTGESNGDRLVALSAFQSSLLLVYNGIDPSMAISRRDLNTRKRPEAWRLSRPYSPSVSGCALNAHELLALSHTDRSRLTWLGVS